MDTVTQLKKYMMAHPPNKKKSKFDPVIEELQKMKSLGYTFREMVKALDHVGIKAYPSEIKRYLDRKSSVKPNKNLKKVESSKKTVSQFLDTEPKG